MSQASSDSIACLAALRSAQPRPLTSITRSLQPGVAAHYDANLAPHLGAPFDLYHRPSSLERAAVGHDVLVLRLSLALLAAGARTDLDGG